MLSSAWPCRECGPSRSRTHRENNEILKNKPRRRRDTDYTRFFIRSLRRFGDMKPGINQTITSRHAMENADSIIDWLFDTDPTNQQINSEWERADLSPERKRIEHSMS